MKNEKASIVVEVLFVVPVLMLLVMLTAYSGRLTQTSISLRGVASVSARRASQASAASMMRIAELSVQQEVSARRLPCGRRRVSVTINDSRSSVSVSVRCVVRGDGPGSLGVPDRVISATATAPIDRYRHS